ncbi:MAG: peptide chain release factor N(5)-glutamine methyltransferase [Candidatus Krumholzibacteriia bacterium]
MNADVKTVRSLLQVTAGYLEGKGVDSARLNAERLLADVLGLSRIELFMQHDRPVLGDELDRYRDLVRRRAGGEPLQQILGETEFYSRPFKVEPGVFIPRPETERLVEIAAGLLVPGDRNLLAPVAVEIGTGTGIVAVSLALEVPRLTVWATEIDPRAADLARRNARRHGVEGRVTVLEGSRFAPLPERLQGGVDLLVSNPPYIRTADIAGLAVEVSGHDPHAALDGGADGLVFYRALAAGLKTWLRPGGHLAVEIGADQGEQVVGALAASGAAQLAVHADYAGRDRVVTGLWPRGED